MITSRTAIILLLSAALLCRVCSDFSAETLSVLSLRQAMRISITIAMGAIWRRTPATISSMPNRLGRLRVFADDRTGSAKLSFVAA